MKRCRKSGGGFREDKLEYAVNTIASGRPLPETYRDHALQGLLKGYRECHIQPDLLLVYKVFDQKLVLVLAHLGSHDELFGE
ncbi:MAG: type II toxin-antitoxin system YafQ family toxin [Nanoarchaeota archaeon]|nr:type II toxin-antitoxin system YafQ family toxin [Nanoarchaeota archaeon]